MTRVLHARSLEERRRCCGTGRAGEVGADIESQFVDARSQFARRDQPLWRTPLAGGDLRAERAAFPSEQMDLQSAGAVPPAMSIAWMVSPAPPVPGSGAIPSGRGRRMAVLKTEVARGAVRRRAPIDGEAGKGTGRAGHGDARRCRKC